MTFLASVATWSCVHTLIPTLECQSHKARGAVKPCTIFTINLNYLASGTCPIVNLEEYATKNPDEKHDVDREECNRKFG